jgi:lipoprotein LprG
LSVIGKIAEMPVKTLKGVLTNEPSAAAKGTAKITIMGSEVDVEFVVVDDHLYVALPGADWHDYGPTAKAYDVTAILNPEAGLANMLTDFVDPTVEARETVRGYQTIRIAGKVTADAVNKIGLPLNATKRMSCTVWIQESGDHQLVEVELEPSKDNSIRMDLSNWNAPVTVEKPAGV